nr:transposase (putative), gypsy type [Tanacetum cinerariifolium]
DPLPLSDEVYLDLLAILDKNRVKFRKYRETVLCVVGLSQAYDDRDSHPTFLYSDDEEVGLFDLVIAFDPFKVKVEERILAEGELPLIQEATNRDPLPLSDEVYLDLLAILDKNRVKFRKYRETVLCVVGLSQAYDDRDSHPTFLYSDDEGSTLDHLPLLYDFGGVTITTSLVCPRGTSSVHPKGTSSRHDFYESLTMDTTEAKNVYVLKWDVTNEFRMDNPWPTREKLIIPGYFERGGPHTVNPWGCEIPLHEAIAAFGARASSKKCKDVSVNAVDLEYTEVVDAS